MDLPELIRKIGVKKFSDETGVALSACYKYMGGAIPDRDAGIKIYKARKGRRPAISLREVFRVDDNELLANREAY